jgi:hypothetical protein
VWNSDRFGPPLPTAIEGLRYLQERVLGLRKIVERIDITLSLTGEGLAKTRLDAANREAEARADHERAIIAGEARELTI